MTRETEIPVLPVFLVFLVFPLGRPAPADGRRLAVDKKRIEASGF